MAYATTDKTTMAISFAAARITFWAAALFLALLAVLHIVKPEYDPTWRMISEYEIGRFGWAMQLAFISLSIASVGAIAAVGSKAKSIMGYIGLVLLLVAATGMIIGGIFPSDPITTDPDALSASGEMHILRSAFPRCRLLWYSSVGLSLDVAQLGLARDAGFG